ncbi:MAG: host-nuclease inhibitor Gam family protein [Phycisphaeraceae bacterium]|nr:host-nuclease inhibitor Gam family protein [Phycisphaeraceae bacterium]
MKTIVAADARPTGIGKTPKIKDLAGVDAALHELAWLRSRRATVEGAAKQSVELIKAEAAKKLVLEHGEPFDVREQTLVEAVVEYAGAHREQFVDGKTKSRKFVHGVVGFREQRGKVTFLDGDAKAVIERLADGLAAKLTAFLKRLGLLPWLRLKPELDLSGIGQAIKRGEVTEKTLAEQGLGWASGEEVYVDPAEHFER